MAEEQVFDEFEEEYRAPVIPRRQVADSGELDITPMIDITFLLLIFFLVASTPDMKTAVDLPRARHGKGVSENSSVVITVDEQEGNPQSALVYLADGTAAAPLTGDPQEQAAMIEAYIREQDRDPGRKLRGEDRRLNVLVKAARLVIHKEVMRVSAAVGRVEEAKLHWAVLEAD